VYAVLLTAQGFITFAAFGSLTRCQIMARIAHHRPVNEMQMTLSLRPAGESWLVLQYSDLSSHADTAFAAPWLYYFLL